MRLIAIGLTLALAASAPLAAVAQAPVTAQPLAPGEVLVEISAFGMVRTRADHAGLSFNIGGGGDTEAAARADVELKVREIRALLRAQGIADADIHVQPISAYAADDDVEAAMANAVAAMDEASGVTNSVAATPTPSVSANALTEIVIRNVGSVPAIQSVLMQRGIFAVQGANYTLNDDSAPRRQARVQAIQKARADAEAYASALNMRVVRVVRVTERIGLDLLGMAASESQMISQLFSPATMRANNGPEVPTMVIVGVDFALAPR